MIVVETRTYERTQNPDGSYTVTVLSGGEDGWTAVATARLGLAVLDVKP